MVNVSFYNIKDIKMFKKNDNWTSIIIENADGSIVEIDLWTPKEVKYEEKTV